MSEKTMIDLLEAKEAICFELQTLLDDETKLLGSPDFAIDEVWVFAEAKNKAVLELETLREKISQRAAERLGLAPSVPLHLRDLPRLFPEEEPYISRSVETIIFLKGKITKAAKSSASFVESYLSTVEEVIGMLTQPREEARTYGMDRHLMKSQNSVLLCGEA